MFDRAADTFGGIDVLANNAGIMKLKPVAETEDATFDQHVAINPKGTFNGLREAARRMRDGRRIVSFSSSVVGLYQPTYAADAATKAGVEAMSHVLAKELGLRCLALTKQGLVLLWDDEPDCSRHRCGVVRRIRTWSRARLGLVPTPAASDGDGAAGHR